MLHRRDAMIRMGRLGLGAMTLPALLRAQEAPRPRASAKSCILIYLWGGPPQQDTFDMKPDAPEGVRSLFSPIHTVVPGIEICDQLPLLARCADKFAVVRSLTHDSNNHEPSVYRTLTGRSNPSLVVPRNQRTRLDFPFAGSVLSYFAEPGPVPVSVTVPRPIGHDGVTYSGTYAGLLGARHDPMEYAAAPGSGRKALHQLDLPEGTDLTRLAARRGLLAAVEDLQRTLDGHEAASAMDDVRSRAFRMLTDPKTKRAFNLDAEPDSMRDRYGRNEYGESFLLARRLVEAGVRLVTVVWMYISKDGKVANVWDNHGGTASLGNISGYDMLKADYCLPPLDLAMSALLDDLDARGLLGETLVAAYGEFGRTHKINSTGGRDHWGACQSALLAGGGIRGGQIYGASDRYAMYPIDGPASPEDLLATIYHALGVSPHAEFHDSLGRPHRVVEGRPILSLFG